MLSETDRHFKQNNSWSSLASASWSILQFVKFLRKVHVFIQFFCNVILIIEFVLAFGRLRPHTYTFCQLSQLCPSGSVDQWVESFECKNPDSNWVYLINTRLSFYSGHSSLGSFAGTYLVCFLHETVFSRFHKFSLLKKALVILFDLFIFTLYLYPGFTQWQIYWHFGTDILTGFTFGIIYALLIFHTVNQSSSRHSTDRPQVTVD